MGARQGEAAGDGVIPDDLLRELRRLAANFPVPDPSWHGYVTEMQAVLTDFGAAIAALEQLPAALDELARRIERDGRVLDPGGGGALAEARRRLHDLPLPAGEHPFLDEIVVTVEAAATALAALDAVSRGEDAFATARGPGSELNRCARARGL